MSHEHRRRPHSRTPCGLGGNPDDPRGFRVLGEAYFEALRVRNFSAMTIVSKTRSLEYFRAWCDERGLTGPAEITRAIAERYQRWLFHYRRPSGQPLTFHTQHQRLMDLQSLFRWLCRQNYILYNPAADLEMPRLPQLLPKNILSTADFEILLALPDLTTPPGLRDRAILETFYSTAMRRIELVGLELSDIDSNRGTVHIRKGKGQRQRYVPIGERALAWIEKYQAEARPKLLVEPGDSVLFVSNMGCCFNPGGLTNLVRRYLRAADLSKTGSCHLLRHSVATILLESGADVRYVQEILGHAKLETTAVYTHVAIGHLKQIHSLYHPAAWLHPSRHGKPAPPELEPPHPGELLESLEDEKGDDPELGDTKSIAE